MTGALDANPQKRDASLNRFYRRSLVLRFWAANLSVSFSGPRQR